MRSRCCRAPSPLSSAHTTHDTISRRPRHTHHQHQIRSRQCHPTASSTVNLSAKSRRGLQCHASVVWRQLVSVFGCVVCEWCGTFSQTTRTGSGCQTKLCVLCAYTHSVHTTSCTHARHATTDLCAYVTNCVALLSVHPPAHLLTTPATTFTTTTHKQQQERSKAWLTHPRSARTKGVIHFLGGAFAGL